MNDFGSRYFCGSQHRAEDKLGAPGERAHPRHVGSRRQGLPPPCGRSGAFGDFRRSALVFLAAAGGTLN